jgi:hypothetical protein
VRFGTAQSGCQRTFGSKPHLRLPHVTIEYDPAATFSLAGEDVDVQQLIFAVVEGEAQLLVQSPGSADWSVFLVDEQAAARFRSALAVEP